MKKSVLSAAMLLALGVSGAAGAVQMHGVIEGKIFGDYSADQSGNGAIKTWGSNSNPKTGDLIRLDLWFDSGLISSYDNSKTEHPFSNYYDPVVAIAATYNGVTRTLTSNYYWSIHDYWVGTDNFNKDMLDIAISESSSETRNAQLHMAFSDNSTPALRETFLGHSTAKTTLITPSNYSYFHYNGDVNGKTYKSKLAFTPTSFAIAPVPEPETWAMMLLGLGVVGYAARRRAAR